MKSLQPTTQHAEGETASGANRPASDGMPPSSAVSGATPAATRPRKDTPERGPARRLGRRARDILVVTRHPGAADWVRRELNVSKVTVVDHLDGQIFRPGDKVCGVLPIAWAARICAAGAEAHVLTLEVPFELRGVELDADTMSRLGARLIRYDVRALD